MPDLIIHGGKPLSGTITPSGNKNSVLPILCATLLTDAKVTLLNVPLITDVEKLANFFTEQGSVVAWDRAAGTMTLDHSGFDARRLNGELPAGMRSRKRRCSSRSRLSRPAVRPYGEPAASSSACSKSRASITPSTGPKSSV